MHGKFLRKLVKQAKREPSTKIFIKKLIIDKQTISLAAIKERVLQNQIERGEINFETCEPTEEVKNEANV